MSGPLVDAAWTLDKQEISLEVNIFYQYDTTKLYQVYGDYRYTELQTWRAIAYRSIKDTTVFFSTQDFFNNRIQIQKNMTSMLKTAFQNEAVIIISMQLGRVVIPPAFETAVENKVVMQQRETTTLTQRNSTLIDAQTQVVVANGVRRVTIVQQQAQAKAALTVESATAYRIREIQGAYENGYAKIATDLQLNKTQLAQYIWAQGVAGRTGSSNVLVGFEGTTVEVQTVG